ncbi:DUF1223 domain-containing protein [Spirosoma rhododendri]|uniref:DUF1223 domain-containing protein n=1 Tax=Spirosoma rhododendri TaxID=2728024 RepID=A0A7L5DH75_9BACT|nr:DUF1223 domain-containing protein [Spirosoma rhododendri]QJD77656.1 DUF1223 domain-containing protein [Spirosoma rhododendri]
MLTLLLLTSLLAGPKNPGKPMARPVVVLELFTSQGCSSCPSADQTLKQITDQANASGQAVYGLSFHVDYWNRLGWRDPFSSASFTNRQRQYDRALNTQTYTPQLIINGRQDIVGSQSGRIQQSIRAIQQQPAAAFVGIDGKVTDRANGQIAVQYELGSDGPYRLNAALVQKEVQTVVKNGENGGRTLTNTNVVRDFKTLEKPGRSGQVLLTVPPGLRTEQTAVLLYIQRTDSGQIVGAVRL